MKRLLKALPLAAMLAVSASVVSGANFEKVKVDVRQESAPEADLKSGVPIGNRQRNINTWLMLWVEYQPVATSERNEWCDDVTMTARVVCPGPGEKEYTAFTGTSRIWTVRCDGSIHQMVMAIPPQLLDRCISVSPGFSRSLPRISRNKVRVEVVFRNSAGRDLGRGFFNTNSAADFTKYFRAAGQRVVEGGILPREQTPWGFQPPAYFDLSLPAGGDATSLPGSSSGGKPASRAVMVPPPRATDRKAPKQQQAK